MSDDINNYLPSILNPRTVKKHNVSLTQNSVVSRCSLSLRRSSGLSKKNINKSIPAKKQLFSQSQNPTFFPIPSTSGNKKKCALDQIDFFSDFEKLNKANNPSNQNVSNKVLDEIDFFSDIEELNKENNANEQNVSNTILHQRDFFSDFEELNKENNASDQNVSNTILTTKRPAFLSANDLADASTLDLSLENLDYPDNETVINRGITGNESIADFSIFIDTPEKINPVDQNDIRIEGVQSKKSLRSISSATTLDKADETLSYDLKEESHVSVAFGVVNCECVNVTAKNSSIKKISFTRKDEGVNLECELVECVTQSTGSELDENMNETSPKSQKRAGVAVSLEIKKKKLSSADVKENSKVLILKTDAIKKLSHVIVQPPNCKLVKHHILDKSKIQSGSKRSVGRAKNGKIESARGVKLSQRPIDSFFSKDCGRAGFGDVSGARSVVSVSDDGSEMSRNLGVADAVHSERSGRATRTRDLKRHDSHSAPKRRPDTASPRRAEVKLSNFDAPHSPVMRGRNESASSHSPRKNADSIQFSLSAKSKSKTPSATRNIPHYKIVAGTHFAVDAFAYGDIPNVKHYFLTHFHSDHYAGLKKSFNKFLYCSQITGDLCISRLGLSPKCLHILTLDNPVRIEGVEVTAVDANHCPGAVMLIFTLPNGKTILHTGDFRASPAMESYPQFWNKDIHTIYLDTTYCNIRYDFPTQDQSLEMALSLLRDKKMALEKNSKKFSSVLIICGTYTIGKEKFFLGLARRVGCSVWACPEKDKVLQAVEGRSFGHAHPHSCQLHVVPMRDLTHEKLKSYLDSMHGAFTEVVAFKPSGWENGKNSTVVKDCVTIHGIPYSEHSSFSELIRFVKFLKPKQVVPTVDISGGIKAVQKYFPCPLVYKEDTSNQSKVTDYFSIQGRQQVPAVT